MQNQKLDLQTLVLCAVCTATTCVLAIITVPIQPVPFTLGSVGACIAGGLLGFKKGALTQLLYCLLVLAGLPFTPNFKSGLASFLSPTGGYKIGFIFMAAVTGLVYRWLNSKKSTLTTATKFRNMIIAGIFGTIPYSGFGLIYYIAVTGYALQTAVMSCVVPFIFTDFIKIPLAAFVVTKTDKLFQSNNPSSVSQ